MHPIARTLPLLTLFLSACSDPPDESPLGRDMAATLARPEQPVDKVKVQHVLIAFVGAKKGSESNRNYEQARDLTTNVLARARAGEDFAALINKYSGDDGVEDGRGTYWALRAEPDKFVQGFQAVAFHLAPGDVGVVPYHRSRSPFGFHVIKRIE